MVLWWRAIAKAANEWIVWLCVMNYDLQSIPNGTVWKIFALLCELKTRSNVKYREVETHQTRRCFLSLLLSSVAELCVNWKSQRPVLGWQERWPSVAPCCCSQWLDHLIMMFVLMSSCTDVPEKKLSAERVHSACAVSFWQMFCGRVEMVSWNYSIPQTVNCVKSNHLLLLNPVCSRPWKQSRRDWKLIKRIEKKQCCEPICVTFGHNI